MALYLIEYENKNETWSEVVKADTAKAAIEKLTQTVPKDDYQFAAWKWVDPEEWPQLSTVKEIREHTGLSRAEFSRAYGIPIRTLENWDAGARTPPEWVVNILERIAKIDFQ